jgi:Zn-dependent membrane protease YugP
VPKKASGLLENRFVLYGVFMLSLINVYVLLLHNRLNALSVFFLTGIIVSAFCKNMIVILLSSIVVTNLRRLPLRFPKGSRATKRKRTRKRKTTGWRTTSPTAVK